MRGKKSFFLLVCFLIYFHYDFVNVRMWIQSLWKKFSWWICINLELKRRNLCQIIYINSVNFRYWLFIWYFKILKIGDFQCLITYLEHGMNPWHIDHWSLVRIESTSLYKKWLLISDLLYNFSVTWFLLFYWHISLRTRPQPLRQFQLISFKEQ